MKIYKYLGPKIVSLAFSEKGECSFKCTYPKDFNDPYELFLTVDFQQEPDLLATYRDAIGELPQLPTTCFSKSPNVIPMWAHYAHSHRGFVIEIDETILLEKMPELNIGDVDYCEGPSEGLADMLARACRIGKMRYFYLLQRGVFSAAYFTKLKCWSYEEERRLIANEKLVKIRDNNMLLNVPVECITAIISGNKANDDTKSEVRDLARAIGAKYFDFKIGRSTFVPYFVDLENVPHIFKSGAIEACDFYCQECCEPTSRDQSVCPWCAVTEEHENHAAKTNSLRMLDALGQLDDYYKSMDEISRKNRKKK